jgi:hypothetical protein
MIWQICGDVRFEFATALATRARTFACVGDGELRYLTCGARRARRFDHRCHVAGVAADAARTPSWPWP